MREAVVGLPHIGEGTIFPYPSFAKLPLFVWPCNYSLKYFKKNLRTYCSLPETKYILIVPLDFHFLMPWNEIPARMKAHKAFAPVEHPSVSPIEVLHVILAVLTTLASMLHEITVKLYAVTIVKVNHKRNIKESCGCETAGMPSFRLSKYRRASAHCTSVRP